MTYINQKLQLIYDKVSKNQVLGFSVVFLFFTAIVLPYVSAYTTEMIGVAESPDTNFSFSLVTLYSIVDSYGRDGRLFYITMRWTFDVIWPIVYTLFLVTNIGYLSRETACKFKLKPLYLPLLAILFDFLENINATIIMLLYPTRVNLFGYLLFASSILKWAAIGFCFLIVILLVIRLVYRKVRYGM